VAARLLEGQRLCLVREPDNRHDANAIRVETTSGIQAGYLNARLARHFAPLLDCGERYDTYVSQVTGGEDRNYGVNIIIQKVREETREQLTEKLACMRKELSALDDENLLDRIRQALLGERPYRDKQKEAIRFLLQGCNTLAIFEPGGASRRCFRRQPPLKQSAAGILQ